MLADTIREHYENNQLLDEILHEEAMQEFYHYCIVGGMPAAVKADLYLKLNCLGIKID
mgnify:CR=1 FL=1